MRSYWFDQLTSVSRSIQPHYPIAETGIQKSTIGLTDFLNQMESEVIARVAFRREGRDLVQLQLVPKASCQANASGVGPSGIIARLASSTVITV